MPPTCSPKKIKDAELTNATASHDYGYITPPSNSSNQNDNGLVANLLQKVPEVERLFNVHEQIGEGTFSTVFLATLKTDPTRTKQFALKQLIPTCHPDRIKLELKCLLDMGGKDNIVGIDLCLRAADNIVFVMPYMRHDHLSSFLRSMNSKELAFYMKNLLIALARVHSFNIIHRDVKPTNFLYDRRNKKFMLVDFGLAQTQRPKPGEASGTVACKRKRENSPDTNTTVTSDSIKHATKKLNFSKNLPTIPQNTPINSTSISAVQTGESQKENALSHLPRKSPFKSPFKSPLKSNISNMQPPSKRSPGKRRLFADDDEAPTSSQRAPQTGVTSTPKRSPKGLVFTTPLNHSTPATRSKTASPPQQKCSCYGKSTVCKICIGRKAMLAPRAGTPGFRPPEVLLKSPYQTTAVDIWAAGVIMLCILSGCYPFFQGGDDVGCLAEIITLFGDNCIKKLAHQFGRHFICSERKRPLDLRKVCTLLRDTRDDTKALPLAPHRIAVDLCTSCKQFRARCLCLNVPLQKGVPDLFPDDAYSLLYQLLDINPETRITAVQALEHPFLKDATL